MIIINEDWDDIAETLFVLQNKELADSLMQARKEPYEDCSTELEWSIGKLTKSRHCEPA